MTSLLLLKSMLMANALSKSKKKKKKLMIKQKPIKKLCKGIKMCRICDEEDGEIPIFNNVVHPNLCEEIHNFSGVRVENSDGLSKNMCQNCLDLLNGCIMFREMCQKTNKKIIEMEIKKERNAELTVEYDNYTEYSEMDQRAERDSSYVIPSPNHSEECSAIRCTSCDKDFPHLSSYNTHRKQCHKVEPCLPKKSFLCDVCGKTSKSRASLLVHKTTHENVFPYKCELCEYRGRTLDLLKVHKRSHLAEAERPYRCPHCPKATTSASNLSKHIRHVHSANKAYQCTYCERAFSFQHDMKRHVKEIHLRQGTVECDICCKKFNTKKILRGHQYKIHKVKGERQGRIPSYLQAQLEGPCDKSAVKVKGDRQGRIAAYLQDQSGAPCDNSAVINTNDNEPDYIAIRF